MKILETLIQEEYFTARRTLNDIIEQAKNKKATVLKPNELSGPLGRFARDGKLEREKNADGQYEYFVK